MTPPHFLFLAFQPKAEFHLMATKGSLGFDRPYGYGVVSDEGNSAWIDERIIDVKSGNWSILTVAMNTETEVGLGMYADRTYGFPIAAKNGKWMVSSTWAGKNLVAWMTGKPSVAPGFLTPDQGKLVAIDCDDYSILLGSRLTKSGVRNPGLFNLSTRRWDSRWQNAYGYPSISQFRAARVVTISGYRPATYRFWVRRGDRYVQTGSFSVPTAKDLGVLVPTRGGYYRFRNESEIFRSKVDLIVPGRKPKPLGDAPHYLARSANARWLLFQTDDHRVWLSKNTR